MSHPVDVVPESMSVGTGFIMVSLELGIKLKPRYNCFSFSQATDLHSELLEIGGVGDTGTSFHLPSSVYLFLLLYYR